MSAGLAYSPALNDNRSSFFKNQIVDNAVRIENGKPASGVARGVKTHNSVLKSNSGWATDPVAWARRAAASKKLMEQNDRIADALQRAGEDVIRSGGLTLISAVTNIVETQRVFRAVRFLPVVAARDRRPLVNGLKLFMHEHQSSKYFRYAVMTCAEPVPAFGDLRGAIQNLSRRISKWSHWTKKYDIKVLFRGIEFTRATAEERGMTDRYPADTVLYHVHANVLYWPTRALKATEWAEFLRETHEFVGAEWKDNGKVERIEEIVKYCSKPGDTLKASDDELVWLYRQTQRLKICQPLGEFKVWMKKLVERREKVVRVHLGRGDGKLMRVKKGKRGSADEANADEDGNVIDPDEDGKDAAEEVSDDVQEPTPEQRKVGGDGGPVANIVIGLSLPQWRHTPWAEPMIMVQDYDPLKLSEEAGCDIREWKRQARAWWDEAMAPEPQEALRVARLALDAAMSDDDIREAAEAAFYIVHTCRPTVQHDDQETDEEELDDDIESIVAIFEGATVIRLKPRRHTEDDEIPFETLESAEKWANLREIRERDFCRKAA